MSDKLGTPNNPHTIAPDDWLTRGVEYGAWCKCGACGYVSQSTYIFDFHAAKPGDKLNCQNCELKPYGKPTPQKDATND